MTILEYKNYLVNWLKEQVEEANVDGLIVGVSGGIDSALVANLIKEAFPNNHLGVIIPIQSSSKDMEDAYELVNKCKINHLEINLNNVFEQFTNEYDYKKNVSLGNTKARLRMVQLYALASELNYLVVGTDNKCEWYTGYFTKHGDGGVDLAPLLHLDKSEVYEMARLYDVPTSILEKQPSADLGLSVSDEEEMGVSYDTINNYLNGIEVTKSDRDIIEKLHQRSNHKRNLAKKPDVLY